MSNKEFNNIKIPENIDQFIEESFHDAYKLKNRKRMKKVSGVIAAGLLCFIMLGMNKTVIASAISQLQKVFEQLEDRLENNGKDIVYGTSVGETVSSNGVDVTLTDIIFDGRYLYVSYMIKSEEAFRGENIEISEEKLSYEHKEKLSFNDERLDLLALEGLSGKFVDDYTFEGIQSYDLECIEETIPDNFQFEILINLFRCIPIIGDDQANLMRAGEWGFKIDVTKEVSVTKRVEINSTSEEGITISDVVITPYEVYLNIDHDKEGLLPSSYIISIIDGDGNELELISMSGNEIFNEAIFRKGNLNYDSLTIEITDTSSDRNLILKEEINIE